MLISLEDRFLSRMRVDSESGCWVWIAYIRPDGYGLFSLKVGSDWVNVRAHRWAYEHFVGHIPPGLEMNHLCSNRACVNPDHLEVTTRSGNNLHGAARARAEGRKWRTQRDGFLAGGGLLNLLKTHCPRGHPYSEANTYVTKRGLRQCRACHAAREQERRESLVNLT